MAEAGEPRLVPGPPWPQSDHTVFEMSGVPAIALTSWDLTALMQHVTHSAHDNPDLVDVDLLEATARAIARVISRG